MEKNKDFDYAGNLETEIKEIKKIMSETKEQDLGNTLTYVCSAFLTILCC